MCRMKMSTDCSNVVQTSEMESSKEYPDYCRTITFTGLCYFVVCFIFFFVLFCCLFFLITNRPQSMQQQFSQSFVTRFFPKSPTEVAFKMEVAHMCVCLCSVLV